MSFQSLPHSLPMDKLFIDVRLDAVPLLDNNVVDLTGRRTFTVGMMRENKGFGITDIHIETKSSLQPIVEITFKDLYGNTAFESLNDQDKSKDKLGYSLLFDWPPPKFRFTFKGYLGKSVTWIMNLKKTTTRFSSSDGSYEIKASFVPNSWGFLADIPFLYLLSKKRLKRDVQQTSDSKPIAKEQTKIESIFDIIKIGKTIETKTKQVTKEFDTLQKQLSVLKTNSIDGLINKDFEPNDVIDGKVAGRQSIKGVKNVSGQNDLEDFTSITITLPPSLSKDSGDSVKFQETLKSLKSNPPFANVEHRKIIALIGNPTGVASKMGTIGISFAENNSIAEAFQNDVNAGIKKIDNDLKLIDVETKRRVFETSETQLGAVTIAEVFSRLAADGGYILGSILDAGYKGYNDNKEIRSVNKLNGQPLIGRYFPLTISPDSGEQVPATAAGIENSGCEMSFVRRFLQAISEGIAENQASQNQDDLNSEEDKLASRINNLEIINPNPYKDASGKQIIETLLVRSGIAAYITRSFNSNAPGDYNTSFWSLHTDNDSTEEIKQLANKELKNITDSILSSLSSEDYSYVKEFCRFINNLLDPSGDSLFSNETNNEDTINVNSLDINEIKQLEVKIFNADGTIKEILGTVDSVFRQFISPTSIFFEGAPKRNSDSINYDNFTAGYLYHNNTLWMLPQIDEKYTFVLFNNSSNQGAIDSVQNNETDSEFNSKESKESSEPLGIVKLSNGNSDESKNPDEHVRLETINERIALNDEDFTKPNGVLDYTKLQNINSIPLIEETLITGGNVYYPNVALINNGKGIFRTQQFNQDNIGNGVTYLVYSHITSDLQGRYLTWGLFRPSDTGGDVRGRNQRVFLRAICTEIENRMSKIEDEKNNVLSQVLGKAQSNENSLYIQMHHIFHQWGVLGFSMDNSSTNTNKSSTGADKITDQPIASGKIAETLEKDYGTIIKKVEGGKMIGHSADEDSGGSGEVISSTGFRYDFPMEKMMNPPPAIPTVVGNSIINIEPLYKPNANTTLLSIIQQLCTKNNFMFVPIPGNVDYTNISEIFEPSISMNPSVGNIFHVLFTPTPESRTRENNGDSLGLSQGKIGGGLDAFEIEFGSPDNVIIKNLDVSTEESRPTAESILNLQRLVDKDNSNKVVTTDCSILSVMEGRSYKMKVEMIGNAQISPMQYFYVSRMPIFSGLYQVMNVSHSIKANDMSTTLEGVKMRFDTSSNMRGIGPITLESLKALGSTSGTDGGNMIQPNVGTTSPYLPTGERLNGLPNPTVGTPADFELDLIPGTYLNNDKKSITLVQIDGVPVEINTAKAYLTMKKAAKADGINLFVNSCFRPQWGEGLKTVSSKGKPVNASSQTKLRRDYLQKPNYPDPNHVQNPQGFFVTTDSDTLKPQQFKQLSQTKTQGYFTKPVATPGESEHGNGIAMDLNTGTRKPDSSHTTLLRNDIYIWLVTNGWKYGFVRTVKDEEWHFDYNPTWAKLGPYGGFMSKSGTGANTKTIEGRNAALFYTDLGLSNLTVS